MTLNEPQPASTEAPRQSVSFAIQKWLRLLLAGNPFYIASAALLLFGINRLSVDPRFLSGEEANLIFSFSALQVYEIVLIGVVVFLAARRILYDSTLLVVLESIVLFVPFILVTQAAMIGKGMALLLCAFGAGLVAIRFSALKSWFSELNLPGRSLALLGLLVALNGGVPLLFRKLIEAGGSDAWEVPFRWGWLLILPLIQFFALGLPRASQKSDSGAGRAWLPFLFFRLWIAGTAVHFWSMGYVAEREAHLYLLTPLLWALCWTGYYRRAEFGWSPAVARHVLLAAPVLALFAASTAPDSRIFFVLAATNTLVFLILAARRTSDATHLFLFSLMLTIASLPEVWASSWIPDFSRMKCLGLGIGALIIAQSLISKRPAVALCGAIMAALAPRQFWPGVSANFSMELGFVFLLLQSLRWEGDRGGERLRIVTAATWIVHAFGWTYVGGTISGWTVSSAAVIILLAYGILVYLKRRQMSRLILAAAMLVLCSWPVTRAVHFVEMSPPGVIAVVSSFLFLGAGTWFALSRKPLSHNGSGA